MPRTRADMSSWTISAREGQARGLRRGRLYQHRGRKPLPARSRRSRKARSQVSLAAEIQGNTLTRFRYRSLGQLVDLGSTSAALTDILGVKFSGIVGEAIWRLVYLKGWAITSTGHRCSPTGPSTAHPARCFKLYEARLHPDHMPGAKP